MDLKKWKPRTISLAFAIGMIVLGGTACGSEENVQKVPELIEPVGVDIDTAEVKKMNLSSVNSYPGEIVPDIRGLYFLNSGQVDTVKVNIGDKVKKGQLLATLKGADTTVRDLQKDLRNLLEDNAETNAASKNSILQLKEELKNLKKKEKKAKKKREKRALHKQVVMQEETIKTEQLQGRHQRELQASMVSDLRADIANARKKTKLDKLYSDVNGEVISKTIAPGDFIGGGGAVIQVADMDKTRIRTEYIGNSILNKASNYHAMINGKRYEVTVDQPDISQFDVEMGNYPSNTYFDYKKDMNVSVGDSVSIDLYNDEREDALVVPSNAVYKAKGTSYVYRMEQQAKKKVVVTVGTVTDAYTQILSGVKEGDVVYVQD